MVDKRNDYVISRLKEKYGDKYDYSLIKYKGWRQPITLVCNRCGNKRVVPTVSNALSQNIQCAEPKCKKEDNRKAFEERGKELYGGQFDYSNAYTDPETNKCEIKCTVCGDICYVTKSNHYKSKPMCSCWKNPAIKPYDYSNSNYLNTTTPIKIYCKTCKEDFIQLPTAHLQGNGCKRCALRNTADKNRKTLDEFLISAHKVHGNKYDYSNVKYTGIEDNVDIRCLKHDYIFKQTPHSHLRGGGCPICASSIPEQEIADFLQRNSLKFIKEYKIPNSINKRLRYDFYIPKLNLIIELDGPQHYRALTNDAETYRKQVERDNLKTKEAYKNGHALLRIKYTEARDHLDVLKTYLSTNYKYLVDDNYFKSPVEVIKYLNLDRDANTKIISAYKVRYY